MRYYPLPLILALAVINTTSCGYHLYGKTAQVPPLMKTITLNSYDPYSKLTRAIRTELTLNAVTLLDATKEQHNTLPSLQILNASESLLIASVLQDGKAAEYQMILSVNAQVLIPGKNSYPINVKVYRSFFDTPRTALEKDSEKDLFLQELRQQAAQQLVRKLLTVSTPEQVDKVLEEKLKKQKSWHLAASA
ncbi:LPS assembly lipoprotein LptE [secondary endosymbiont of Ctenarytaina eucalypti]|uniref:LPS-assembly lipoprotein LptE n=1 Tax=secondary endosymbiont of Ctenarytaina eucalypti TaxID=1199245 RepID=J3VSK2_9ENTR|nr:LPS assembly lipoprotein LptE [secondary endosymbiont of Ctenarytaina eucalypti]AFP84906.1 Rare lipoprotein B [secondary endosymbiont of Ctenarytaina eucalypti]